MKDIDSLLSAEIYFSPAVIALAFTYALAEWWMPILVCGYLIVFFYSAKDLNELPRAFRWSIYAQIPFLVSAFLIGTLHTRELWIFGLLAFGYNLVFLTGLFIGKQSIRKKKNQGRVFCVEKNN